MHAFMKKWMLVMLGLSMVSAAHAEQTKPAEKLKDDTYVTISGTVGEITDADEFTLKYNNGTIKVDTNDIWPNLFRKDAIEVLKPGDKVTVSGVVDDNLFTKKEIDARSIAHKGESYVRLYSQEPTDTAYGGWSLYGWDDPAYGNMVRLSGKVNRILDDNTFEMTYGTSTIKVDLGKLDRVNTKSLHVGEKVMVFGDMDDNWFGKRELDASYLIRTDMSKHNRP